MLLGNKASKGLTRALPAAKDLVGSSARVNYCYVLGFVLYTQVQTLKKGGLTRAPPAAKALVRSSARVNYCYVLGLLCSRACLLYSGSNPKEGVSDQSAAGSEGLGAQLGQGGGLVLHGVVLLPVLPGLGQRHDEELLAQRILHLVIVGGLVEVAGEELGQQLLQHIGAQEQQAAEQHPEQQRSSK